MRPRIDQCSLAPVAEWQLVGQLVLCPREQKTKDHGAMNALLALDTRKVYSTEMHVEIIIK